MLSFALIPPRDSDSDDMPDHLRDELLRSIDTLHGEMLRGFQAITDRLDKQNGRIGSLERRESAHHERLAMLEEPTQSSRGKTAVTLTVGGGIGVLIVRAFHWLVGR